MSLQPNERPPDLEERELPEWALSALRKMREAEASGHGHLGNELGETWYLPEQRMAFWPRSSPSDLVKLLGAALWPAGMGLLIWGLIQLRTAAPNAVLLGIGGALALAGAFFLASLLRRLRSVRPEGLLVAPGGLLVVGKPYRAVARDDIHQFLFEGGALIAVWGPEHRRWRQYSAPPGTTTAAMIEGRQRALAEWKRTGLAPAAGTGAAPRGKPARVVPAALKILAGSAAALGFVYLTLVLPARSGSGEAARAFVEHLSARRFDDAYALLSEHQRSQIPRDTFESSLPAPLRAATGFTVNSISSGVGSTVGETACVGGLLDGVDGYSGYAFVIDDSSGDARIAGWREGPCRRR